MNHPELYGRPVNFAVVRLPDRKHAGVVLQGDTLHLLTQAVTKSVNDLRSTENTSQAIDRLEMVVEQLSEAKSYYQAVCSSNGLDIPYEE